MPAVLSIGHDPMLLKTRASLLQQVGAEIVSSGPSQAISELEKQKYDLVILCHSLHPNEAHQAAELIKNSYKKTAILMLSRDAIEGVIDGIERCGAHRPEAFLKTVKRLLKR